MGLLDKVIKLSDLPYNKLTVIIGKPGSGKTTLAGTYPKPLLYVSIGSDGGGVVLKKYGNKDISPIIIKSTDTQAVYHQLVELFKELKTTDHGFKTVLIDAYSSIEEDLVIFSEKQKGKKLSLEERGIIGNMMTKLRDTVVELSLTGDAEYVLICHIKNKEDVDNITGEKTIQIIPKMTYNNGNVLLERASNVMYCTRKPVKKDDGTSEVKFLTYIGAHPYIDTKLRRNGKGLDTLGVYVENCTYADILKLLNDEKLPEVKVVDAPLDKNPFVDDDSKTKGEW